MSERRGVAPVIAILCAIPTAIIIYKLTVLGYALTDILPRTEYRVAVEMRLDGHGGEARIRTFVPVTDDRQTIRDERNNAPALHFNADLDGLNRAAVWTGGGLGDDTTLSYAYAALVSPVRYDIDPALEVPNAYAASVAPYLRPEDDVQVDSPDITAALTRIGADKGPLSARVRRIYDLTSGLVQRPFKGTTDALTALRLGEASCNGKSRLFVALARAAGIPARLVGGIILERTSKKTSHQWVEIYVAGHWVPFCPTNHHYASLPATYLTLYRGDQALFKHTSDINFDYRFTITGELVPSPRARESFQVFNVWALFERLGLPFSLLRTILMLPIGAFVVVVFRNVVGLPTFGTFLPALIAAAASETGGMWGVIAVLLIVGVVSLARWAVQRLGLLHSPTLALLLGVVALTILSVTLAADRLGLGHLTRITMFPLAVMAITAERFYLALTENGPRKAAKELGGTLLVMLACYVVMSSLALQVLVIGFPEVLLYVMAADVYLGRWVGVRLSEYLRFRQVLDAEARS